jgi:hypothetical protein
LVLLVIVWICKFSGDASASWAVMPSELPLQILRSSSAKADDPVRRDISISTPSGDYWIPAFAGMTVVLGAPARTAFLALALS